MLAFDDFIKSNYSSFEIKTDIWKKETDLFVNIPDDDETILKTLFNTIRDELNWIEINKNKIDDVLIEEDLIELAENTTSSAHILKCADEECYMLDDGSKVYFPITKDNFLDSLYIESISIDFDRNDNILIEIILACSPDYFRGESFVILMDNDKNIKFNGLMEK